MLFRSGLSNFVLKPLINAILFFIMGDGALENIYTYLHKATKDILDEAGTKISEEIDLSKSIYIDWGSFINAIINFFLVAFVLFCIVKFINNARERGKKLEAQARDGRPSKEDRKEMKNRGIKFSDADAVAAYYEEKAQNEAAAKEAAAEKARLEREANPTTEDLLKQIRDLLKEKEAN